MAELQKKVSIMPLLRQAGLSELACQFAQFIQRQDKTGDPLIVLTAGLLSDAVSQGHVCLNLNQVGEQGSELDTVLPETVSDWMGRLEQSHLISKPGEISPMVLTASGQVYLYRYWHDEQLVDKLIQRRLQTIPMVDVDGLKDAFSDWPSSQVGIDWQKIAVMMALSRQLSVISGGPGTGKTTIVLRLLQLLLQQDKSVRIALAAPTGKAAARLQQAISEQGALPVEAKTIHRLLGMTADNDKGRYHADKPLPVDVLIVDEASMIDISLMATIMKALPRQARLVLLGDSDQLSSIESGAVLANLCREGVAFSPEFCERVSLVTGIELQHQPDANAESGMMDSVVMLQDSYRFDQDSDIARLALAVKTGDDEGVIGCLLNGVDVVWHQQFDSMTIQHHVVALYSPFFDAVKRREPAEVCLALFDQSRVLCALKQGPESVDSVNTWVERGLIKHGWRTQHHFYHGRPIMVTQNDYRHGLFNGDTGLILYDDKGQLSACFLEQDGVRWLPLNRLPAHETAYAMTVHKSQGSEFDAVCIVLPDQTSPVLNRALLYTAMTRAKLKVSLVASESIIRQCVIAGFND
jgi:exodeoxyribonuclease V alpha subunit